nr:hypothetical protein BaRGS_025236 [Batillaria attramentaria]
MGVLQVNSDRHVVTGKFYILDLQKETCLGHFLVLYHTRRCFPQISILMQLDARGCYWPVSEVINLQVFPRFSPSEACVAVMRNCHYKRKVFVYKLPVRLASLQELCRRAVLHLVTLQDLRKLPLPCKLLDFVMGKVEPSVTPSVIDKKD